MSDLSGVSCPMTEEIIEESTCTCGSSQAPERSFSYVEGTKIDKNMSLNASELSENVWFETKPPVLFSKANSPIVTSRQTYITRVLLNGKLKSDDGRKPEELRGLKEPKSSVSIHKKKSAIKFLGDMKEDFDNK